MAKAPNLHREDRVTVEGQDLHHPYTILALFLMFLIFSAILQYAD